METPLEEPILLEEEEEEIEEEEEVVMVEEIKKPEGKIIMKELKNFFIHTSLNI